MNFEEMLNARETAAGKSTSVPFGVMRQTLLEQKYRFVVALKPTLADNADFRDAMERDRQWSMKHTGQHQLQYELPGDGTAHLETGTFLTLAQAVDANPALVATQGFVDKLMEQLMDAAAKMHAENVCQVNFAPQNIFLRKGSNTPLLLFHGSFYHTTANSGQYRKDLYEGCEQYIAPEVMEGGEPTQQSDIYSLGKLIEWLFSLGGMTVEYKLLLKKATAQRPEDRFKTIGQMKASLEQKRNMRRSLVTMAAAVAIALLCVWLYIDFMPQRSDIEFIEPAKRAAEADPFDQSYDPDVQMVLDGDTIDITDEDMEKYTQKAEQIFRKRFEEAAEEKIATVFDKANRGDNEKSVMAESKHMQSELEELQTTIADDTGISPERAAEIANDVIEQKMAKKKKEMEMKHKGTATE